MFKSKWLFLLVVVPYLLMAVEAKEKVNVLSFTTIDGKKQDVEISQGVLKFKEYSNKIVLLNFFGKRCPPCLKEIPHLVELQKKYKKDFQIVSIEVQTNAGPAQLKEFGKRKNINYPVATLGDARDIVSFISYVMEWQGQIPFMMLFNKDGKLVRYYMGMVDPKTIESDIKKANKGK